MSDCVFCLIIAGELPSTKVYETDQVLAIRDINPAAPVHVIVFPKQHLVDIVELGEGDPELGAAMIEAVAAVARIEGIDTGAAVADHVIDATGLIVCPGLIDIHVSLREPGDEKDETIQSGTAAALAGGMTSVACMPDTSPVVDNRAAAEFVQLQCERAGHCNVFPLGAVTKNHDGQELAEIGQLVEGGAVAFTDAKSPVANAEIMRRALEYTRMFGRPIFNHPQVPELAAKGIMHEGYYSMQLGLRGIPAGAEVIMAARDIALAEMTGGHIHLMTLSTTGAVDQVRRAKAKGIRVTAEVTPHHLALTDASLSNYETNFKVDPPLRTKEHIDALIEGLRDGTIDVIATDHAPHCSYEKEVEFDEAPFGVVGLETALGVYLTELVLLLEYFNL